MTRERTHHLLSRINRLLMPLLLMLPLTGAIAQQLSDRYNKNRPLIVVCDWDKAPYEYRNDQGQPAGSNIDLLKAITHELGIPCEFVMKEWTTALKTFERNEADLILANVRRYHSPNYFATENIINYNRICVAMAGTEPKVVNKNMLMDKGVVMKYGDYVSFFFRDSTEALQPKTEFQSPKVALQGLIDGDYHYFLWGEEPLKWKLKELGLKNIVIGDVDIPVSEIHIIGHDKDLIYQIDDRYSRLKQSGEVQRINDRWLHPERAETEQSSNLPYIVLFVLLLCIVFYGFMLLARAHVMSATRNSSDLNNMMYKALHMGNIHLMEYDIKNDRMTNRYGKPLLPERGITLKEFAGHIHPNEVDEFQQKMRMLMNGRERKFELKKRWRTFDAEGQWLTLEGHAIVELDSDGRPAYIINAVSDVTQNVEEDRAARELIHKYKKLSNMPFMAMSFYDKDGYLIDLNDSMRELCGITPDHPESQRYWLNVCMFDIPLFRSAYQPGDSHQLLACMHMDYPEMDIDRYVEYDVRPLFNNQGEVANYFCSTLDITELHARTQKMRFILHELQQTRDALNRYERWLNFLTKQGSTYLWYSVLNERTAYFYRSLQSSAPGDFVVMPFETHLSHMPEAERAEAEAQLCCSQPDTVLDAVHHFNSTVVGGGESWFHITGTPILDADGHVTGHRGQSIDITLEMSTKKKLEKEQQVAKDIVRLKSGFMASMTHELRTPLNAIIGFTDIIGAIDDAGERSEYIRIIRSNCDMLQRLINDILEASSFKDGAVTIEVSEVDFSKSFDDICLTLQQRIPQGVTFIKENPYTAFFTKIDVARVAQVITNFMSNAVKFTKEGHIKLGYRYREHGLYISCEDTGAGIPKEKQSIVFDRFVKLDEFVQGTGMGLNICKTIAERLGGRIGVESEGPGQGCYFWMWLPCERMLTPQSSARPTTPPTAKKSIQSQ